MKDSHNSVESSARSAIATGAGLLLIAISCAIVVDDYGVIIGCLLGAMGLIPFIVGLIIYHLKVPAKSGKVVTKEVAGDVAKGTGHFIKQAFIIIAVVVLIFLSFFILRGIWNFGYDKFGPKDYTAFFYYNPDDLEQHWSANVDSIEECRDWVDSQATQDFDGYYDYECGVNCKTEPGFNSMVCKETLQ